MNAAVTDSDVPVNYAKSWLDLELEFLQIDHTSLDPPPAASSQSFETNYILHFTDPLWPPARAPEFSPIMYYTPLKVSSVQTPDLVDNVCGFHEQKPLSEDSVLLYLTASCRGILVQTLGHHM